MTTQSFDPERYKTGQQKEWDQVAEAWRKWWSTFEGGAQQVSKRLADLAGVKAGDRVLDISTGIGEPAATVAAIVGANGSVVATDHSPGMLAVAKQRLADLSIKNVELVQADTETMDLPENEFDAIVCRWGLMFLPDLGEALQRVLRSLKPGGKFATAVWSTPDKVSFAALPFGVAQQVLQPPPPPPPPDAPNMFKLGAPNAMETAFSAAGFASVEVETLTLQLQWSSAGDYRTFMTEIAPPIRALVADREPAVQDAFWEAILAAAKRTEQPDGSVLLPGDTILATGTKKA